MSLARRSLDFRLAPYLVSSASWSDRALLRPSSVSRSAPKPVDSVKPLARASSHASWTSSSVNPATLKWSETRLVPSSKTKELVDYGHAASEPAALLLSGIVAGVLAIFPSGQWAVPVPGPQLLARLTIGRGAVRCPHF